jgi:hypothetical protein
MQLRVPEWCTAKGQTSFGQAGSLLHELSQFAVTDGDGKKDGKKIEFAARGLTLRTIPTLSDAFDKLTSRLIPPAAENSGGVTGCPHLRE